jgi:hypothetical protein
MKPSRFREEQIIASLNEQLRFMSRLKWAGIWDQGLNWSALYPPC